MVSTRVRRYWFSLVDKTLYWYSKIGEVSRAHAMTLQ